MPRVLNRRHDHVGRDAVLVDRTTKWGNPFAIDADNSRRDVVGKYLVWLFEHPELVEQARRELAGKDLVCWCAPSPCHADTLLALANHRFIKEEGPPW